MNQQWTVVTVSYNSLAHLERCWRTNPAERDYKWIVVDNGSTDGSVEFAGKFADLVIESGRNGGFSFANNLGLQRCDSEFVAFVNPDVVVAENSMPRLAETIAKSGGLVAPQLLNSDGTLQSNARGVPFLSAKVRNRLRPHSPKGRDYARAGFFAPTFCAWTMGAAVAGRSELMRAIGGWDESYFLYYEDHEIGLRAWERGYSVVLDPGIQWVHHWERATTRPSVTAWRAELASMRTFYGHYPELLSFRSRNRPGGAEGSNWYGRMLESLWKPIEGQESN